MSPRQLAIAEAKRAAQLEASSNDWALGGANRGGSGAQRKNGGT